MLPFRPNLLRCGSAYCGTVITVPYKKSPNSIRPEFPMFRIPYAERKPATGREVLLVLNQVTSTRHEFVPRHCRATGREVLLVLNQVTSISHEFAPGQARYAERKLATGRVGPMVSFDHRPARTNCPPALPGKTPLFHVKQGRSVIGSVGDGVDYSASTSSEMPSICLNRSM